MENKKTSDQREGRFILYMNSCAGSSKGLLKSRKGVDETEASGHIAAGRIVEGRREVNFS